jgi:hypothetical protein
MYVFEMIDIVKKLSYKGAKDFCTLTPITTGLSDDLLMMDLKVAIKIKDRTTGKSNRIYRHHVFQADELRQMSETRLIRAVKDLLVTLEIHEVEEQLIYCGKRVYDPHAVLTGTDVAQEKKDEAGREEQIKKHIVKQLNDHISQNKEL